MKQWYDVNKKELRYKDSDVANHLLSLKNKFKKTYEMIPDTDKYVLDAILRRGLTNIHKLCVLDCVCNFKKVIEKETVEDIFKFYSKSLNCVKYLTLTQNKLEKQLLALKFILKEGKQTSTFVYEKMKRDVGITSTIEFNNIKKIAVERKYVRNIKEGNYRYMELNEENAF